MAELNEDNGPVAALEPLASGSAPFEGEGVSLEVTEDVNPTQLVEEVYTRLGNRDRFQVVVHYQHYGEPISEANPLTLYVHPQASTGVLAEVVGAHVKDPDWGLDDQDKRIRDLKERLTSQDLSNQELNELLRTIFV